jgi:hypothetical protein
MNTIDNREWHPVTLPSYGLYYNGKVPDGKVMITPWTTAQEEMMARYSSGEQSMAELMVLNSVKFPEGFSYDQLLITDSFYLLVQLRVLSLCSSYSFTNVCTACRNKHESHLMLHELSVRVPDEDWPQEPFDIKLPKCKKKVGLQFLRIADQKKVHEMVQKSAVSSEIVTRLARQMVTIDGQPKTYDERVEFIRNCKLLDSRVMDNALEKWVTGYLMEYPVTCPKCQNVDNIGIPSEPSFFRPRDSDIAREEGMD